MSGNRRVGRRLHLETPELETGDGETPNSILTPGKDTLEHINILGAAILTAAWRLWNTLGCHQVHSLSSQCWPTCCLPVLGYLTTMAALCRGSRVRSSSKSPSPLRHILVQHLYHPAQLL